MKKAGIYLIVVGVFWSVITLLHAQNPTWEEYKLVINTNCSLCLRETSNGDEYFYFWIPSNTTEPPNPDPITLEMYLKDVTPSKFALSFNTIKDWMLNNTDVTLAIYYWQDDSTTIAGVGVCGKSGP